MDEGALDSPRDALISVGMTRGWLVVVGILALAGLSCRAGQPVYEDPRKPRHAPEAHPAPSEPSSHELRGLERPLQPAGKGDAGVGP